MNAERLLPLLKGVKQLASNRWMACCPAHDDKSPSLSIRELEDGRILLHCFAGCGIDAVMSSLGMSVSDLFRERLTHHATSQRPNHWHAALPALRAVEFEGRMIAFEGERVAAGHALSVADRDRLLLGVARIRNALKVCE